MQSASLEILTGAFKIVPANTNIVVFKVTEVVTCVQNRYFQIKTKR